MNKLNLIIKRDDEEPEAAEVLVEGAIAGRSYRFLLDTGAARSSVTLDDFTSTIPSTGRDSSSGVFASSSDDLITVPSIEVGPISKRDVQLVRATDSNLIGMDLLKEHLCHFVFDEGWVSVDANDELDASSPWQKLVLDKKFHPYVVVKFGDLNAAAVWDTGAGITIVDTGFIEKHSAWFQEEGASSGTDSTGAKMQTSMFVMSPTLIGGCRFPPVRVAGVDLSRVNATIEVHMDLILGYNVLSKANWLMDFPGRRWAISKELGAN